MRFSSANSRSAARPLRSFSFGRRRKKIMSRQSNKPGAPLRLEELESRLLPSYTLTTLASFGFLPPYGPYINGAAPTGSLIMDSAGNLYGTAEVGGAYDIGQGGDGTIFELVKGSGMITKLADFNGAGAVDQAANGEGPVGGVIMDSHGNLFGT